jgi:methionyl aminopeptidase
MINLKTEKEIKIMQAGGKILAEVLEEVIKNAKAGVSELELDNLAEKLILEKGGKPGFKKVDGYKYTTCISTNDVVVHGVPTNYKLKEGDEIGIDCGVYYQGYHTDMAQTKRVGSQKSQNTDKIDKFLKTGEKALWEGIRAAKSGNRIGDISKAIQSAVEGQGYSVVRSLIGHGVGKKLHEEPEIPGFLDKPISRTPLLKEGMTIAIEVIYNMGKSDVIYSGEDGWTIKTKDGSLSGLFEKTIVITKQGSKIITQK